MLVQLFSQLFSQPAGMPIFAPASYYTLGGIIAALGGTILALARAYAKARDDKDKMADETLERVISIVQSSTEASTFQKTSNESVARAMGSLDHRIESLERRLSKMEGK